MAAVDPGHLLRLLENQNTLLAQSSYCKLL